jgi:hypothetical protein
LLDNFTAALLNVATRMCQGNRKKEWASIEQAKQAEFVETKPIVVTLKTQNSKLSIQ